MTRIYTVKMSNGDVYGVPAIVIADNYATYYHSIGENYKECFEAMIHWFDTGDYEFADWAKSNMDWDEVKNHAFIVKRENKNVDYQDDWVNGEYCYLHKK